MRKTARRKNDGQALRDAMAGYGGTGIGLKALAARTAAADPAGRGVSHQLIGFLTQDPAASRHARDTCTPETAVLIEKALGAEPGSLFDVIEAADRSDPQPGWDDLRNVGAR